MKRRVIVSLAAAALLAWVAADLFVPRRSDLRSFDARDVARLETRMWRSYYDRRPLELFLEMSELLRTQYRFSWLRSQIGAYHAAKGAYLFKGGRSRAEYERALPDLRAFYSAVRREANIAFDADEAARKELEWWIVHRERARYGKAALEDSLARLQACLYGLPAEAFRAHATARAEAMLLRDAEAERGGVSEAGWRRIGALLDRSWSSLHGVVQSR
jgi:hypothetical protein